MRKTRWKLKIDGKFRREKKETLQLDLETKSKHFYTTGIKKMYSIFKYLWKISLEMLLFEQHSL